MDTCICMAESLRCLTETITTLLISYATAAAKSLQSCTTLCDPIDGSPPGSPIPGILQARTLEWVAISFSSAWKWKGKVKSLSRVWLLAIPWTAAYQAPLSMGFSRQEYRSGLPLPSLVNQYTTIQIKRCKKKIKDNRCYWRMPNGKIPEAKFFLFWRRCLFFSLNFWLS